MGTPKEPWERWERQDNHVQAMMGHADSRTTSRYLHARPAAEGAAKLTKIFAKDMPSAIVDEHAGVA